MKHERTKLISILGLGPVGLVTAVCFAKKGYRVVGIDTDDGRLQEIRHGRSPIYEPDLSGYLRDAIDSGRFTVTDEASGSAESAFAFICVGTPAAADGSIDLSQVRSAASSIGRSLRQASSNQIVVIKSTVTPGTARNLVRPTIEEELGERSRDQFGLCSNPEFLRQGKAVQDAENPDRIIIGSDDPHAIDALERLYGQFHGESKPHVVRTSHENAELIKYASNAFLATKISFINTIANIAERISGADIQAIADGIGLDPRIGRSFLNAGLGYGGSCFPKDLNALIEFSKSIGYEPLLIEAVRDTNRKQWRRVVDLATGALGSLKGKRIAILGLAFKPDTDDLREAVSIPLIKALLVEGAQLRAYDPAAIKNAREMLGNSIEYASDPIHCISDADCCILVTEWGEFARIPPRDFAEEMHGALVIDGRRVFDPIQFSDAGVRLLAVGLGPR